MSDRNDEEEASLTSSNKVSARIIAGRYVLTNDPIRSGGMSTVQKAIDPLDGGRVCAIKRMKTAHENDHHKKESFFREQAALTELSEHPHIVSLYDVSIDEIGPYIVLEWLPQNLLELIEKNGPLPWERFYREVGRPVLEALAFAQSRGWNHRDIKPQNILFSEAGLRAFDVSDRSAAEQFISTELNEIDVGFRRIGQGDAAGSLRIWAIEWVFELARSVQRDRLVVSGWRSRTTASVLRGRFNNSFGGI